MNKRFLAPLLILVFLSCFASSIPILLVSASPDPAFNVLFVAWDQSGNVPLPKQGCKWHLKYPDSTDHIFSGNQITLSLDPGTYDISVSWQGSFVIHNWTKTFSAAETFDVTTNVTDVVFTANDHDGNPLYDGPCYWYITYPVGNATTFSYHWASGTLKLGNGTYYLRVKWQGTYVTGNTTWNKNVDTSKSMDCSVVDRTFVAKDHDGGQTLLSGATRIWVMVPNGTWCTSPANASSFTIKKLSYEFGECTVKVRFENTTVFQKTLPLSSEPVRTYEAKCDVYQYTPRLLDQEGRPYGGAEIHLQYPDGAIKNLKTDGDGRVSIQQIPKGSYSIPEVIYDGRKVNQTAPFFIEGDLTDWLIQFNGLSINQTDYPGSVHLNSTFTVRAKLVYSYSGKPVSGGKVGLLGASWLEATTDASGWAKFDHLSEWQPTEPFTLFGVNDPRFGLTYSVQNATVAVTWTGDFQVQALDAKGSALNHASVLVSNETGGYWKTVYTDSKGLANVNAAPCQSYAIAVEWQGVEVGSTTINLNRAKMSETISCAVYYWDIKVGNLDGTAISGASVTVYRPDGTVYGTYKTMGTGYIPQIKQIPKETYRVMVDYTGAIFGATINLDQNLETQLLIAFVSCPDVPNVGKLCYSTSSSVSSITYNGTFKELRIELSGPTGTSGSVSVFVPRTLLDNLGLTAENIHTFLDSEPVAATIEDHPDGYLVVVSYTHSSHVVEVVFSDITLITTVKDSNNRAINGANIKLYRGGALVEEGYTEEDGEAVFTNLATGEYEIKTFHLGVLVKTDRVTLLEDLDYRANCPVYDLTIQVFDMIPSSLPSASVTASLPDGRILFSGTTNGAGVVVFLQVPAENYKIKATYFGISSLTDVVVNRNLTIQIYVPTLNMTTIVLLLTAVGTVATLVGASLSKRGEEIPKRRRGRPRKVETSV